MKNLRHIPTITIEKKCKKLINSFITTLSITFLILNITSESCAFDEHERSAPLTPEEKIADWIKPTLTHLTPEIINKKMEEKFRGLKLMDHNGKWVNPAFTSIANELIPPLEKEDLSDFVDNMARIAADNPYLHKVLVKIMGSDLSHLNTKTREEKYKFVPDAIIFAKALDNLTYAARRHDGILEASYNVWEERQKGIGIWRVASIPFCIKFFSVRYPLSRAIDSMRCGHIQENQFNSILPINILEATLFDLYKGNFGNAYAGWQLAINPPGMKYNPITGAGPTKLSKDGKACQLYMPFCKSWNDLYCSWNLGFVAGFSKSISLNYISKLLIPSVNDYRETPSEYIFNRTFALYATLNYEFTQSYESDSAVKSVDEFDYSDPAIIRCFDSVNRENAINYREKVQGRSNHTTEHA